MSAMSQRYIPEAVALEVMRAYRLPTLRSTIVRSLDDLTAATPSITYPVAMKIISRDIVHKTEVGGVRLGVYPDKLQENYTSLLHDVKLKAPHAALEGVLLAEMAPSGGVEYVIGVKDDPSLGHLLMFGLGGIYVETLRDVSFRLAPLTVHDARSLISEIKSAKLIRGVRGLLPLDEDALTDSLLRISQLVTDHPQIKELDINPILVLPKGQGVRVLDARMVIG